MGQPGEKNEAQQVQILVEGMTCSNCAAGLTKVLSGKGLEKVHADFASGEVSYANPHKISEEEVESAIHQLGYKVKAVSATEEPSTFTPLEKKLLISLLFTIPLFMHMFVPHNWWINNPWVQLTLALPVFIIGILHFGKSAWGSIRSGVANMDVLIFTGSSAAFFYSLAGSIRFAGTHQVHEYLFFETSATIITLVLLGNVLEQRSVKQTTTAIRELAALQPSKARVRTSNGSIEEIDVEQVQKGDTLMISEGDKIPLDSEVLEGEATIDESIITGESLPVTKDKGQEVVGGTLVLKGNLLTRVIRTGNETVLSQIIEMVRNAQRDKPPIQQLGDKVSAIFVPIVLAIALVTFIAWYFLLDATLAKSLMTSVAVLVISCPCAMGLATPTAVMAGLGRAAKNGILIKGGSTLQNLASIRKMVFDKTGTLTTGEFKVADIKLYSGVSMRQVRSLIKGIEVHSSHPIARSLTKHLSADQQAAFSGVEELKGTGMKGSDQDGNLYFLGSRQLLSEQMENPKEDVLQHQLYLFKNKELLAGIDIADDVKAGTKELIGELESMGISTALLSGDYEEKSRQVARQVGIAEIHSEKKPDQKLELIEAWNRNEPVAMVGDGINDAPALARSTTGISLGNSTQIAIQSAQVIILNSDDPSKIKEAVLTGRHTLLTIKQNLFWAFFYNIVAIPIAAAGLLNPMVAALAMAASDVVVIGNSIRLKYKRFR